MKTLHWLVEEAKTLFAVTVYFAACFTIVMLLKQLLLAEYGIAFSGLATALIVALVTAKVVIVLQKVPLAHWLRSQPLIVEVIVRTVFYTLATMAALLLEKAFESRSEHGSFAGALANVLKHRDVAQVWATTICIGLAFLAFNTFGAIRHEIGGRSLWPIFFRGPAGRQADREAMEMTEKSGGPA